MLFTRKCKANQNLLASGSQQHLNFRWNPSHGSHQTQTHAGQHRPGSAPKDLQNLVQFKVIRPARRDGVCWFNRSVLLQAKVAFYLKKSLGSSSDLLGRFTQVLSRYLNQSSSKNLTDVTLRSRPRLRPVVDGDAVEVKIPLRSLARELEEGIDKATRNGELVGGRNTPGWKEDFLSAMQEAGAQLGDITEEEIIRTIQEYRAEQREKKLQALQKLKAHPRSVRAELPEITVVAHTKKKTA